MSTNVSRPSPTSPPEPSKPPVRGKLRWLWITLGLCGVAVIAASAGALLAVAIAGTPLMQSKLTAEDEKVFGKGDPISTGMNFRLPQLTRPVNILILGVKVLASDVNNPPPGSTNLSYDPTINSLEGLADSMLLLRFNPPDHQLVVLSLPRDTRTMVDGAGLTKLNEANALGGPASAARATSDLLGGVGIDRYIRINVLGVEKLIDALGGVTVYVPQDMSYQDQTQHLYINLKRGEQHLNGDQAVQFLRFRYDQLGDIGRVQRQQMFIRAMREQVLKPETLTRLPKILSVIQSNIDTNLSVEELVALAGFASGVDRSNMQMLLLPGSFSPASYWLPDQQKIAGVVRQYFGLSSPNLAENSTPNQVRVAIQDSTGKPDTVEKLVNALDTAGFGQVFVDTAWAEPLQVTHIIAQEGDAENAEAIRRSLGFGEVLVESTGNLQSDITIRLGLDSVQALKPGAAKASPAVQPEISPEPKTSLPQPQPAPQPSIEPSPSPAATPQQALPQANVESAPKEAAGKSESPSPSPQPSGEQAIPKALPSDKAERTAPLPPESQAIESTQAAPTVGTPIAPEMQKPQPTTKSAPETPSPIPAAL